MSRVYGMVKAGVNRRFCSTYRPQPKRNSNNEHKSHTSRGNSPDATFFEVGIALLRIRDGRLYPAKHQTFDRYCHERWGIGSSYARRVIRAAERVRLLPADGSVPKPTSEFQVRPFLQLEPEVFPKAWQQLITRSHGGRISPSLVKEFVAEFSSAGQETETGNCVKGNRGRFGEVFTYLYEARKRVQNGETERALAAIERVEDVLSRYL